MADIGQDRSTSLSTRVDQTGVSEDRATAASGSADSVSHAQGQHSPLPWGFDMSVGQVFDGNGDLVVDALDLSADVDDAGFIVRACNSHYELLAALKSLTALYDGVRDVVAVGVLNKLAAADAAIAKAEGRS